MIKVAAALIRKSNQILVARRSNRDYLDGLREFPGGKIEAGETPENCLHREILEELNISIEVECFFTDIIYDYPGKRSRVLVTSVLGKRPKRDWIEITVKYGIITLNQNRSF